MEYGEAGRYRYKNYFDGTTRKGYLKDKYGKMCKIIKG